MKRLVGIFCLTAVLSAAACVSFSKIAKYEPGSYQGEAEGYGGNIVVQVETDSTSILDIRLVSQNEDPLIGADALEALSDMILEYDSTDVDAVSGATITSEAFLKAVDRALMQALLPPRRTP